MGWFTDLFGPLVDTSPAYNFIFGIILIFAGIMSFKFLPGFIGKLIAFGMLLSGLAIALGYWIVIQ